MKILGAEGAKGPDTINLREQLALTDRTDLIDGVDAGPDNRRLSQPAARAGIVVREGASPETTSIQRQRLFQKLTLPCAQSGLERRPGPS